MIQLASLQYKTNISYLHGYTLAPLQIPIYKPFKALQGKWRQKERELRFRSPELELAEGDLDDWLDDDLVASSLRTMVSTLQSLIPHLPEN